MALIRLSKSSDKEFLVPMVNAAYSEFEGYLWKPGHERLPSAMFDVYHAAQEIRVAQLPSGEVVGCIRVVYNCSSPGQLSANIGLFAVMPGQRGTGLGNQLVWHVFEEAKKKGCSWVDLELMYPRDQWDEWKMDRLKSWYERLGFVFDREVEKADYFPKDKLGRLVRDCRMDVFKKFL